MKRLFLCLSLLMAPVGSCAAQTTAVNPPAQVPPGAWAFAADKTMQKEGMPFAYPNGTTVGKRPFTRYEFAVATARVLLCTVLSSPDDRAGVRTILPALLRQKPLTVNALMALTVGFAPELRRFKLDVSEAVTRLEVLHQQEYEDVLSGEIVLTAEQLQSPFADVPSSDASRLDADTIMKAGIVLYDSRNETSVISHSLGTRLQMATAIARVLAQMPLSAGIKGRLRLDPRALAAMQALVKEFTPEIRLLELDPVGYQTQLAELTRPVTHPLAAQPFSDVPTSHWAAGSVETLRRDGLIAGYPNGHYTMH